MTRRLVLINLSNHEDEDYQIEYMDSDGNMLEERETITLAPGKSHSMEYEYKEQTFLQITPVTNVAASDRYKEPTVRVTIPSYTDDD